MQFDTGQPMIFGSADTFAFRNEYNEDANDLALGFGLGMTIYDAPGVIIGPTQIPIDLSKQEISPQVILQTISNPTWLLVILMVLLLLQLQRKG